MLDIHGGILDAHKDTKVLNPRGGILSTHESINIMDLHGGILSSQLEMTYVRSSQRNIFRLNGNRLTFDRPYIGNPVTQGVMKLN